MRFQTKPSIWFLDKDLIKSAESLKDDDVEYNIIGCYNILLCSILYGYGIRNHNLLGQVLKIKPQGFDYIINALTNDWPLKKKKPACKHGYTMLVKLCRQSKQSFDYILEYMLICLNEYFIRFNKESEYQVMYEWFYYTQNKIPMQKGFTEMPFPLRTIPRMYRQLDYIQASRSYYIALNKLFALQDYNRRSVPEWFNLD